MKQLQPELDALKKKYPKDKQKFQEEQMKLYQQHGITQAQMAGCLPTLLQMPILFAFYYAIIGLIAQGQLKGEPFYFIPDLAFPAYTRGFSWLTQSFSVQKLFAPDIWPYLVLPSASGRDAIRHDQTGAKQPDAADGQQQSGGRDDGSDDLDHDGHVRFLFAASAGRA